MVSAMGLSFATACQPGYFQNIAGNDTWYVLVTYLVYFVAFNGYIFVNFFLFCSAFHVWPAHMLEQAAAHYASPGMENAAPRICGTFQCFHSLHYILRYSSAGTHQNLPAQSSCVSCPAGWVSQYDVALQGLVGPTDCIAWY